MIVFLLLVIIAILLFGAAAVRSAAGVLIAIVAGALVISFAFTLSATFWWTMAGLAAAGTAAFLYAVQRDNKAAALKIWAIYEPYLPKLTDDERCRAEQLRDAGDHKAMALIFTTAMSRVPEKPAQKGFARLTIAENDRQRFDRRS